MLHATIFPGRYVQGCDALSDLAEELSRFGKRGLFVCDPFVFEKIFPDIRHEIEEKIEVKVERFVGECSDEEIERLSEIGKKYQVEFVAGLGGGKTLDTAKAIAHELGVSACVVPTIASTDAPCSSLSVIYTPEGKFKRYLKLRKNPDLVMVDTRVIANAPVRFLIAGMGDALATWFEAESCKNKYAQNLAGGLGSMTAFSLARLCYDILLEYGIYAKISCEAHVVETHSYYHGEKVAIGTLTSLFLTDKPHKIIDEVFSFCESVGLPTTLDEIGISDISERKLLKVAEGACAEGETIYNESPAT